MKKIQIFVIIFIFALLFLSIYFLHILSNDNMQVNMLINILQETCKDDENIILTDSIEQNYITQNSYSKENIQRLLTSVNTNTDVNTYTVAIFYNKKSSILTLTKSSKDNTHKWIYKYHINRINFSKITYSLITEPEEQILYD